MILLDVLEHFNQDRGIKTEDDLEKIAPRVVAEAIVWVKAGRTRS